MANMASEQEKKQVSETLSSIDNRYHSGDFQIMTDGRPPLCLGHCCSQHNDSVSLVGRPVIISSTFAARAPLDWITIFHFNASKLTEYSGRRNIDEHMYAKPDVIN